MIFYFLFIRIAALLGHRKARLLVRGQAETIPALAAQSQPAAGKGPVWIHAASAGEFEQARPLIERIKAQHPQQKIVVTFFSPSGYELRKDYGLADGVYYLPFATRRNAKRFLNALQPRMAFFIKYEFWPAYIRELKKRDIPFYSVSSIFRPGQVFFRLWGKGQLRLLRAFTRLYVQDEASQRLLAGHGVHNASVAGDTRFDRVESITRSLASQAGLDERLAPVAEFAEGCQRLIVAGSTWHKDEQLLARYMSAANYPLPAKLILVPHETDEAHLHFIFNLFKGRFVRYSDASRMTSAVSRRNLLGRAQVLLIDTVGLLSSVYRFGQAAYVGGGFGEGIHNTIEAAVYGLPVVFGPNYHTFREAQGLIDAGAARSVSRFSELENALNTALDRHEEIGAKAAAYVQSELGATDRIYTELFGNS